MIGFKIPIFIEELNGFNRTKEPMRVGIPFPRAVLAASSEVRLLDESGKSIPVQARPLGFWPDNTIKWILVDFFADMQPNQSATYSLCRASVAGNEEESGHSRRVDISERSDTFEISTGPALFKIPQTTFLPFSSVQLGNVEIVSGGDSKTKLLDHAGIEHTPVIERCFIEEDGALRVAVVAEGNFLSPKSKSLTLFRARMAFFAGFSLVRLELQIRNPRAAIHPGGLWDLGDPGSMFFKDLSLQFKVNATHAHTKVSYQIYEDTVSMDHQTNRMNTTDSSDLVIYQDSSGGENWNSTNHIDHRGDLSVNFRGYRVYNRHEATEQIVREGLRARPYVKLEGTSGWIAATVMGFWQNFPKALRAKNGSLSVGLFPKESNKGFELQGGEQKRHVIFLDFGLTDQGSLIPMLQLPLHVHVDPEWVEKTGAVPYFVSEKTNQADRYSAYIQNVIEGPSSFFSKREVIDEYGWRNFGDLYGDHEAVNHMGHNKLVSHYNNQYDFIYGALVHFLRTGKQRWYQLMAEAACHTIDIDIYHTVEDKPAYNHGLFWHTDHYMDARHSTHRTYSGKNKNSGNYGGGPSNEHNYTSGLLYYFYLSGDSEAAITVQKLADWVLGMDDGSLPLLGLIDNGPTGAASQTVSNLYHKPGRGAANSINALLDAYRLTNNRSYFSKAEELIQRCIHPNDDIAALKLDEPEFRWSYLVFLQVIGNYLNFKEELGERDFMFFYARDSLLHYADWMVENEVPYKEVLHKVLIPTETWPAHDIRKCHIFHLAAEYGSPDKQKIFHEKACFFFKRCLNDLLSFDTAYLTRPLVILTVYGNIHAYFQKYHQVTTEGSSDPHSYEFGNPQAFVPQKARIKAALSKKGDVITKSLKRLVVTKLYEIRNRLRSFND